LPTTLVDSSLLIAVANSSDSHHASAVGALTDEPDLATPVTILAETMSFIRARLGATKQRAFWTAFMKSGIEVVEVGDELLQSALEIDERYRDAQFGFADSVLLATCEHLKCGRVLTFDKRVGLYRPTFASHLELRP
jgi:predicted nucleic acid-binding protein